MNNLNSIPENRVSIESLKCYVSELTNYINENNIKYTKNLQTLKIFYEQQIEESEESNREKESTILENQNKLILLKDELINRNNEVRQLKDKIEDIKMSVNDYEKKYLREREKNETSFQHIDELRNKMETEIGKYKSVVTQKDEQIWNLGIELKQKNSEVRGLQKDKLALTQKLDERFSLPDKIKEFEMQGVKDKVKIENMKKNVQQLTRERDFLIVELEKKKKDNQKLRIQNNKSKGDISYEIELALKKQKQKMASMMENIKIENERKSFEIQDLEQKIKSNIQILNELEKQIKEHQDGKKKQTKQLQQLKEDKDIYLQEFRKLKYEYEEVIDRLEKQIPVYQQKNWTLQTQNQELNRQLDGLQQLLREVKAINQMEPFKADYRKWAQLNLIADKRESELKVKNDFRQNKEESFESKNWEQLMLEIENITI